MSSLVLCTGKGPALFLCIRCPSASFNLLFSSVLHSARHKPCTRYFLLLYFVLLYFLLFVRCPM